IRLRRPGVTAAATTAVLATGEGPGETALATTAVFATGAPMTPTLPLRAALSGISVSFGRRRFIGLDGGDDRLDGNPSVGNQLAARASRRRGEGRGPQVLPDEHSRSAPGLHGGGEMYDVLFGQQLRQLRLECLQFAQVVEVGELHRLEGAVLVLDQDQDVDQPNGSGVDEPDQLFGHLAREVARSGRELDDDVVDGTQ